MIYNVGNTVKYQVIDEEYKSRGYGISYETGTDSKVNC